ncbi:AI-2E family transporter [Parenemella sanctibonifatiensis]|uniref:AI-2E family transporter n=1 Tax=Parenemella sanctibonifatiensis TaxID=2016505 RepID=A0A255EDY2_9ACTN|nr:AI-2E family transporter [Parenemella sanctibonifatiensis]OYN89768.1 AI-2E family transporter [Parenemella sanctibonifatiensis]
MSDTTVNPVPGTDPQQSRAFSFGIVALVVVAAIVIGMAGLSFITAVFTPAFFALTLAVTARPVRNWLERHHVPRIFATIIVLLGLYAILSSIVLAMGISVVELGRVVPEYAGRLQELWGGILTTAQSLGVDTSDLNALLNQIDWGSVLGLAQSLLSSLSSGGSQVVVVVIALAFMVFDMSNVTGRIETLDRFQPHLADSLRDFAHRIRKYWIVNTVFGLIVAVIDMVALWFIGVPLAMVWGLFAFVTNYIPNIGFVIGVIPPALIALLDSGWVSALWVVIAYSVINFTIQSLIQPKFTGDAVGLNVTVTFLSLMFWTTVAGALGAILAVPLTLFCLALFVRSDPKTMWLMAFFRAKDDEHVVEPKPEGMRQIRELFQTGGEGKDRDASAPSGGNGKNRHRRQMLSRLQRRRRNRGDTEHAEANHADTEQEPQPVQEPQSVQSPPAQETPSPDADTTAEPRTDTDPGAER